jgi:hypothetical protein
VTVPLFLQFKLGGYSKIYSNELNLDEVENQANDYSDLGNDSLIIKLLKLKAMMNSTHPYPVVRVKEIRKWANSEQYQNILNGNYVRLDNKMIEKGWHNIAVSTPRAKECPNIKCHYPCEEHFVFCPNCQTNVRNGRLLCGNCFEEVEFNWRACINCGSNLSESDSEIETVTRIQLPDDTISF